jgi:hypothetical protein
MLFKSFSLPFLYLLEKGKTKNVVQILFFTFLEKGKTKNVVQKVALAPPFLKVEF